MVTKQTNDLDQSNMVVRKHLETHVNKTKLTKHPQN